MRSSFYKQDEHSNSQYPRNEQAMIAHFEREAIAQWPNFGSLASPVWSLYTGMSSNSKPNNNNTSHVRLSPAEADALRKARPDPLSGFGPAFKTLMGYAFFTVILRESDKKAVRAQIRECGAAAVRQVNRFKVAMPFVLANEVRAYYKKSRNEEAVEAWEEMSNWPFANAKLDPLPRLTAGACQPMVKALAGLRETASTTIEDEKDGPSTASLLEGRDRVISPELRGMLKFAEECERYQKYYKARQSSSNGMVEERPKQPSSKATETGTSSRPRKTVLEWLGEQPRKTALEWFVEHYW